MLDRLQEYSETISVPLISFRVGDAAEIPGALLPTKENLRAILDLLGGGDVASAELAKIPSAIRTRLNSARPEDLVLFTFSGHGGTDESGHFYLYPYNLGSDAEVPRNRLISSDELADWFRRIDAGAMVLILDSCRSGAATGPGFRPAPFGDPGLGQLSYDKRMPILAASQADEDTIALGQLRHGALSYALGTALQNVKAGDQFSLAEWLRSSAQEATRLNGELQAQRNEPGRPQEPILFDFSAPTATISGNWGDVSPVFH